jgi:hypothetical protein
MRFSYGISDKVVKFLRIELSKTEDEEAFH